MPSWMRNNICVLRGGGVEGEKPQPFSGNYSCNLHNRITKYLLCHNTLRYLPSCFFAGRFHGIDTKMEDVDTYPVKSVDNQI